MELFVIKCVPLRPFWYDLLTVLLVMFIMRVLSSSNLSSHRPMDASFAALGCIW